MARYIIDGEGDIMSIPFKGKDYKIHRMELVKREDYIRQDLIVNEIYLKTGIKTKDDAKKFINEHHILNSLNAMWGRYRSFPRANIDGFVLASEESFMVASEYFIMCQELLTILMED